MPLRESSVVSHRPFTKDCWHMYGLQKLSPDKFLRVVGNIIEGRFLLLASRQLRQIHTNQLWPRLPTDEDN